MVSVPDSFLSMPVSNEFDAEPCVEQFKNVLEDRLTSCGVIVKLIQW